MKFRINQGLAAFAALVSFNASAVPIQATTVIDFENLGAPNQMVPDLSYYSNLTGGYVIQTGSAVDLANTSPWAANGPAYSGRYAGSAINTGLYREDGVLFAPKSVAIKSVSGDATVHFAGFLNLQSVGTQFDVQVSSTSWTVVQLNFGKVDSFSILGLDGKQLLFDDLTVTSVPEPATYAMLFAGLGLVGAAARRKCPQAEV